MLNRIGIMIAIIWMITGFSCSKDAPPPGTAALNLINAVVGSTALVTNFNGSSGSKTTDTLRYYNTALQVYYGSYSEISSYSGATALSISDISDTNNSVFNGTLNLPVSSIHSLFITGSLATPDSLFTVDQVPYYPASGDSVTGVRFVNLSAGSNPLSIDILGTPNTALLPSLPYKTITTFQTMSANSMAQTNGYMLEFRDAMTDSVLVTYPLNIILFKSQTLAFYGNTTNGLSVMSINNY